MVSHIFFTFTSCRKTSDLYQTKCLIFIKAQNSSSELWYSSQVMWKCDSTSLQYFRTTFFCQEPGQRSLNNDLTTGWTIQVSNPGRG
jgi:hypothetical protein